MIEKEASNIEGYNTKIEELAAELALDEADLKAATEIRTKEEADFSAEEKELMEVIDTLARATAILEREMAKIGSASMLQLKNAKGLTQALGAMVQASLLSSTDASKLTALLQSMQVPAQNLRDEIKNGNADLAQAKKDMATSGSIKAEAEGDLSATSTDLASDEDTKAQLHADCMEKAKTFEAEQKSRGEELKALAEAKKVLEETTSGAASQTYSLVQLGASAGADQARLQALRFVQGLAEKQNSKSLAQLAMQMASVIRVTESSGEDPFAKITTKIDQWTARSSQLKAEAAELQSALAALAK